MDTETRREFRARRLRERRQRIALLGLLLGAGLLAYGLTLMTDGEGQPSVGAQVRDALRLAATAQQAVADYVASHRAYPDDNAAAGLASPATFAGDYVDSVSVDRGFVIIVFGADAHPRLGGKRLTLIPDVRGDGSLAWGCDTPGFDNRDLPAQCAQARQRTP